MKRVLLTVHKFFPSHRAGTELLTLKVAQELLKRHYEVLVVTADPPDTDARHSQGEPFNNYIYQNVPVHSIGESLRLQNYAFEHEYYHPIIKEHFATILHKFRPDIVHMFHAQNLSASIIETCQEISQEIPVVCSTTDFWFICPIVQLKKPDGSVCRGPGYMANNCLTCYTPQLLPPKEEFLEAFAKKYQELNKTLADSFVKDFVEECLYKTYTLSKIPKATLATVKRPSVLRALANKAKAIMVPTKLMKEIFVENGIDARLIHHVPFGIDTSGLEGYQFKTPSPRLRIGFIGTLFEHKGPDLLIKAFQSLPQEAKAELKIYGDLEQFPDYGKFLLGLTRGKRHVENIHFLGTFPNNELGPVLQGIDVLVVPSRWYENTPLVIQSALATKTPLIVTNLGGMAELVHHEFNGLLFELNNVNSLHQQLLRLLNDRNLLQTLIKNIAPERTIAQMVNDIESIYNQVLAENNLHDRILSQGASIKT